MPTLMFQDRFADKVQSRTKLQTIRPRRRRPIRVGDRLSLRRWFEKPYRSHQLVLREAVCTRTADVRIEETTIFVDGLPMSGNGRHRFAQADGFEDFGEMADWFSETHGLPFEGTLISWAPQ